MKHLPVKSRSGSFVALFSAIMVTTILLGDWRGTTAEGAPVPRVEIKVAEYPERFEAHFPHGGTWKLGKASGHIGKKASCHIVGRRTSMARKRFHVMVESVPMRDPVRLAEALAKWRATGRPVHTFEAGSTRLTPDGQTVSFDGRVCFIGLGKFDDKAAAEKLRDTLAASSQSCWLFEEVLAKANGTLALRIGKKIVAQGTGDLVLTPTHTVLCKKVESARGYSWHGFADRTYRGPLTVRWGAQDALDVVLGTDLEHLLEGVVPSEISAKAHVNALQMQAIAARGEILAKVALRHLGEGFAFCAEQHCQVYKGETAVSAAMATAIAPTRGLVLTTPEGALVDAVYSANCGGHTDSNHLVWTSALDPHLQGIWDVDPPPAPDLDLTKEIDVAQFIRRPPAAPCGQAGVEGADKFRWTTTISGEAWKKVEASAGVGRITEIADLARGPSGRLYRITLVGEHGKKTVLKELAIRRLFGGLRSACFVAVWHRDKSGYITGAEMAGAGWGHGVGMCQSGAQALATRGWSAEHILLRYFPGARLTRFY
jgi:stage II sporulation protein D